MRHLLLFLLLVTSIFVNVTCPAHALEDDLTIENNLLRAEYDLARNKQIYLFLNLEKKQFEIRSSGMTISTIAIIEIRPWGPIPEAGLHLIADKDRVPDREKIEIPPPEGTQIAVKTPSPPPIDPAAPPVVKKFDVKATEVTDMPTSYSLWLEGGGLLSIQSIPEENASWQGKLALRFGKPLWTISHALQSIRDHSFNELTLILSPYDAQRLYWALPVGSALLIPAAQF